MKKYTVTGEFRAGRQWEHFNTTIDAHNEAFAREKILSTLGSRHKVRRNRIRFESVEEAK
jgi:large subunit ribosomal protein LX